MYHNSYHTIEVLRSRIGMTYLALLRDKRHARAPFIATGSQSDDCVWLASNPSIRLLLLNATRISSRRAV